MAAQQDQQVMPTEALVLLLATHEPAELEAVMVRTFGASQISDQLLTTLVTLSNSLSHSLERVRRLRGFPEIKLRCTACCATR